MSLKNKIISRLEKEPMTQKQLKNILGNPKKVKSILQDLATKGTIVKDNGVYFLSNTKKAPHTKKRVEKRDENLIAATIVTYNGRFAFARPEDGSADYFIHGKNLNGAMMSDKILLKAQIHNGKTEGVVVKVTEKNKKIVGTVVERHERLAVRPDGFHDDMAIIIKKSSAHSVTAGERVAAEITEHGYDIEDARCVITVKFGDSESAAAGAKAVIYGADIRRLFPASVKAEIAESTLLTEPLEQKDRIDLRSKIIFTIDGADTKDIDDAVSVERTKTGYVLGVHIADVSHYVDLDSETAREAYLRQYSFYYPGQVIPMLPPELSNGMCSLNPNVDRLAFSCITELDAQGEIVTSSFVKTIIHSRVKGVYGEVNSVLSGTADENLSAKYTEVYDSLILMRELADILYEKRMASGAVEFDLPESGFVLSEDGEPIEVYRKTRGVSENIIEEFMLTANRATAEVAKEVELPIIYRTHLTPSEERLTELKSLLFRLSENLVQFDPKNMTNRQMAELQRQFKDTALTDIVDRSLLRSMAKAEYSDSPLGHFGLAMKDYCHFTSPIRRYADLFTHHVLTHFCEYKNADKTKKIFSKRASDTAQIATRVEQTFLKAERKINDCYVAETMRRHIGDEFLGTISGVSESGIYVMLENTAEGRIHITELSAEYLFIDENYRLYAGEHSDEQYCIGDKIKVKILSADVVSGNIDMAVTNND